MLDKTESPTRSLARIALLLCCKERAPRDTNPTMFVAPTSILTVAQHPFFDVLCVLDERPYLV